MLNLVTRIATFNNFDIFYQENISCQFKTVMEKQKLILWLAHALHAQKLIIIYVDINASI